MSVAALMRPYLPQYEARPHRRSAPRVVLYPPRGPLPPAGRMDSGDPGLEIDSHPEGFLRLLLAARRRIRFNLPVTVALAAAGIVLLSRVALALHGTHGSEVALLLCHTK